MEPFQGPTWARELRFSSNRITSALNNWIYVEWETLIWRSAIRLLLFGSIKKVHSITKSTESLTLSIMLPNRKNRLFLAW